MRDVARTEHEIHAQSPPRLDRIADRATRQHGVISFWQLVEAGFGRGTIAHWLRTGYFRPIHRGVYAVGHSRLTREGRWMAAVLASGRGAVLSHRSTAALLAVRPTSSPRIEVTIPASGRRGPKAITVHVVRRLHADEWETVDGIPATTVARTLFDCAEVLPFWQLERAFEQAERLQLFDLVALQAVCERNPGRRALRAVNRLLQALRQPPASRSELERLFLDFCRAFGLPEPAFNVVIAGYEVDAWFVGTKVIVELDSYGYHSSRSAFENDRAKDIDLKLEQFEVIRVTDRRIRNDAPHLADQLRRLLQNNPNSAPSLLTGAA
jgi:very-short-patch-repair endonuclease